MKRKQVIEVEGVGLTPAGVTCRVLDPAGAGGAGAERCSGRSGRPGGTLLAPGVLPGERASVRLGRSPAEARVLELRQAHAERRAPPCSRHAEPAACPLLCLEPAAQRRLKVEMLVQALVEAGVGPVGPRVLRPLQGLGDTGYRAKAVFAAAPGPDGLPRLGYFAPGSHRLRPGTDCPLHRPEVAGVAAGVEQACRRAGLAAFVEGATQGTGLRFVTVRVSRQGGAWVLFTCRPGTPEEPLQRAARLVLEGQPGTVRTVWCSGQEESENAVVGAPPRLLAGSGELWDRVGRVPVPLEPGAFHQANPDAGDLLVQAVVAAAQQAGAGRALDLYCGAGAYALNLAAAGLEVTGVEREAAGVAAAGRAAGAAGLTVRWSEDDAAAFVRRTTEPGGGQASDGSGGPRWDMVVLNPPRRGAAAGLLADLLRLRPRTLVYVSCNPATLARDVALLHAGGYRLQSLLPVDLLPQTAHLETVAVLALAE